MPNIKIGARQNNDDIVLFMCDNSIRIDSRYQQKIFDLFEKLNARIDGTSVGLAIVKRIIELHKGRIWVEADGVEKGTTFCFTVEGTHHAGAENFRGVAE